MTLRHFMVNVEVFNETKGIMWIPSKCVWPCKSRIIKWLCCIE